MTEQGVVFKQGDVTRRAKQVGYGIAVVVNLVLVWVVTNLLEWDILPFLTDEFSKVEPFLVTSLLVGVFVNLIYVIYESRILKPIGDIATSAAALVVNVQLLTVFPFAFSDGPWDWMTRWALILVSIALILSIIVNLVKTASTAIKGFNEISIG